MRFDHLEERARTRRRNTRVAGPRSTRCLSRPSQDTDACVCTVLTGVDRMAVSPGRVILFLALGARKAFPCARRHAPLPPHNVPSPRHFRW